MIKQFHNLIKYEFYVADDAEPILLEIECSGFDDPGRWTGHPDSQYPGEYWFEILDVRHAETGEPWPEYLLSEKHKKEIENQAWDQWNGAVSERMVDNYLYDKGEY